MRIDTFIMKINETIIAVCLAALMPIKPLILLVGVCISLDTFFGIYRAIKQRQKITSRALSAVISKMALYEFALILFYFIDSIILNDIAKSFTPVDLFVTKMVAAVLVSVEVLSILENIKLATGYDFIDMAKKTLRRGKSFKNEVEDIIN